MAGPESCTRVWTDAFYAGDFDGPVTALAEWKGDLYAGGDFTRAGGVPASCLARWDGETWSEVGGGIVPRFPFLAITDMVVFDDGQGDALFVAGRFVEAGGQPAWSIARWDGSTWSDLNGGCAGSTFSSVDELCVFDDGNGPALYAGGVFEVMGGVQAFDVARWDGTGWHPVGTGVTADSYGVYAMAVWNGQLVVAGDFTQVGETPARRLASWDGTAWSEIGGGLNRPVSSLAAGDLGTGAILFVGGPTEAGGMPVSFLAAWDGFAWDPLDGGLEIPSFNGPSSLCVFDDGSGPALLVGGNLVRAGDIPMEFLARWDGASWSDPGLELNSNVQAMLPSGTALYLGGGFTKSGTQVCNKVMQWDDGVAYPLANAEIGNGLSSTASDIATVDFDGEGGQAPRLFVVGSFFNAGETFVDQIAQLDGDSWISLGTQGPDFSPEVAAAYGDDSEQDLYIAGSFREIDGEPAFHIARWDGKHWDDVGGGLTGDGINPSPLAMEVYDDGTEARLYIAGYRFGYAGGVPVQNIAAWNGSEWSDVGGGIPQTLVGSLETHDDGTEPHLYAGGIFESAGGVAAANVARWDGVKWSAVGAGLNGQVRHLASLTGNSGASLFAAGIFTASGSVALGPIARWDGIQWIDASDGWTGFPFAFACFDDGAGDLLYAASSRQRSNGAAYTQLCKWNGDSWVDVDAEFDGSVRTLFSGPDDVSGDPDGALYVGGDFRSVNGTSSGRIARFGCADLSSAPSPADTGVPAWFLGAMPNPTRDEIAFRLNLDPRQSVEIEVFDVRGERVVRTTQPAGSAGWNGLDRHGRAVPSGTYFYQVRAGSDRHHGRITLVR